MKLPFIVLGFWLLFLWPLFIIAQLRGSIDAAIVVALVYVAATAALERSGYQSLWLRNCAFIYWLQARLAVRPCMVPPLAERQPYERIPPDRRVLYVVEPHGEACFGYATTFVPSVDGRIRLLVWSMFRYIPLLRDLYLLVGLVPATPASAERWLDAGADLAVVPSGLRGLYGAVLDRGPVYGDSGRRRIRVYKINLGFCALAIKRKLLLVPVLSCCEDVSFKKLRLFAPMPFLSTVVSPTWVPAAVVIGVPLDGAFYTKVDALATDYYARLTRLAEASGYELQVVDCTTESRRAKSS